MEVLPNWSWHMNLTLSDLFFTCLCPLTLIGLIYGTDSSLPFSQLYWRIPQSCMLDLVLCRNLYSIYESRMPDIFPGTSFHGLFMSQNSFAYRVCTRVLLSCHSTSTVLSHHSSTVPLPSWHSTLPQFLDRRLRNFSLTVALDTVQQVIRHVIIA